MANDTTIRIALAGNPNTGKTTLFNALTGGTQHVGNWPGVTVEKKDGRLKSDKSVVIEDLPGIYSLSPYTSEEIVSRNYIVKDKPDVIMNIVDASNLERNLYLTTQLVEVGLPVVVALNMMDIVRKNGDTIDAKKLADTLGCEVVEISALKGDGVDAVAKRAVELAGKKTPADPRHKFSGAVENALQEISSVLEGKVEKANLRWYAVKVFERDQDILSGLTLGASELQKIDALVSACEKEHDDDSESIITSERYSWIAGVIKNCYRRKDESGMTVSDKIDRIVTNRILALPIFAVVVFLVYYISVSTVGTYFTDWANDGVFGDGWHLFTIGTAAYEEDAEAFEDAVDELLEAYDMEFTYQLEDAGIDIEEALGMEEPDPADYGIWVPGIPVLLEDALEAIGCNEVLESLILDGIVAGVGAVLGFLPQMLVLFICLAILEDCGYMARIAFVLDRIFRKFGLSGKSFIPLLVSSGCGVPGIMASRTIESDNDRRLTIMTTTFIPCSAKIPIIALIAGACFPENSWWVAPSAYFLGIISVIVSGIVLKKTKLFAGDPAPFVIELPAYHFPGIKGVLRTMLERGSAFVKKAGTLILLATVLVWFLQGFDWHLQMVETEESILADIGNVIAPIFSPLGFGDWRAAVASVTGLLAKENLVGTFGILYGFAEVAEEGDEFWPQLAANYTAVAAYAMMAFNLLCVPCFAAIGALRREMMSAKLTGFAIVYQCVFAYIVALWIYQFGTFATTGAFGIGTVVAFILLLAALYMLFIMKPYSPEKELAKTAKTAQRA